MAAVRTNSSSELELGDYVAILRRRWIWFLLPTVMLPWAAFFYSTSQPDRFDASARVLLGDSAAEEAVGTVSQSIAFRNRLLENELLLATGDTADAEVARRFGVSLDDVPPVSASAERSTDVLVFQATAGNPESAANIANAWAETYLVLKQNQTQDSIDGAVTQFEQKLEELQLERAATRADLVSLEDRLARSTDATRTQAQLQVDREASRISGQVTLIDAQITSTVNSITDLRLSADLALGSGPRVITAATPPASSSNAPVSRNVIIGLVLGAVVGAVVALLRENLDRAIRTSEDLADFGLVHLGSIPKASRSQQAGELALASLEDDQGAQAVAYQKVRSSIEFIAAEQRLRSVAVTSALQSEGKTTTAANLATAMAQTNTRTILIDCDLRRPRIHKAFRVTQSPGITNVVLDRSTLPESVWPIPSLAESFVVLPAGSLPPHPASFMSTPAFAEASRDLLSMGDFVVFDAPPVLPVADTLTLVKHVDGVIVVVSAGKTKRDQLEASLESLRTAGADVVGAVLVGVKVGDGKYEYRYDGDDETDWLTVEEETRSKRSLRGQVVIDLRDSEADRSSGSALK